MEILNYLRKSPNPSDGFKLMKEWNDVSRTPLDIEAQRLYKNGNVKGFLKDINSSLELLAFLRYDYKKILVRTRYLYIDRIFDERERKLGGDDLVHGFFEPILICFPVVEFIGRLNFPDLYNGENQPKTTKILNKMLEQMGNGYQQYAKKIVRCHRHALSHGLRPDNNWMYDLNTEDKYGPPRLINNSQIHINIPHFIDSCILEIEKVCDKLTGKGKNEVMDNFSKYISKRFP